MADFDRKLKRLWQGWRRSCPDPVTLCRYQAGKLSRAESDKVRAHLRVCVPCQLEIEEAGRTEQTLERQNGDAPESEEEVREPPPLPKVLGGAASLLFRFIERVPGAVGLLQELAARPGPRFEIAEPVRLAALLPLEEASVKLAAATGSGFRQQELRSEGLPFTVRLTQFGEEARLALSISEGPSDFENCVVRAALVEGTAEKFSRVVYVREGRGQVILTQDEVRKAQPSKENLRVVLGPVLTLAELSRVQVRDVLRTFSRLLRDPNPAIRRQGVKILTEIGDEGVLPLLQEAVEDPDPEVRLTAEKGIQRLSKRNSRE